MKSSLIPNITKGYSYTVQNQRYMPKHDYARRLKFADDPSITYGHGRFRSLPRPR